MSRSFHSLVLVMMLLLGTSAAQAALTSAVNNNSNDPGDVYVVVPGGFAEDVDAFIDRTHEYNGATAAGLPSFLVGADYVMTANDDKTAGSLTIDTTVNMPSTLYMLVDNRVGDNSNTNPPVIGPNMSWMLDGSLGFTFADTGVDVGIDEGGDGVGPGNGINQTSSVFAAQVAAGTYTLREQNDGGSRNMYGIAATGATTFKPFIASSVVSSNGGAPEGALMMLGRRTTGIAGTGLQEDALMFVDRTHEWQNIPATLLGADYIRLANDDKSDSDYQLAINLTSELSDVYLFVDDRVGDGDNGNGPSLGGGTMDWVLNMGFVDTGMDLGADENGDGSINQTSSVFLLSEVPAGTLTLFEQNDGGSRNMYGVAVKATVPEPMTGALALLALSALGVRTRRRRA